MPFTPSTAAQNTAALAGSNMATLATPLTGLQTSISGGNLAPAAYLDAILSSVGFQVENAITGLASNSTTSTSFVDMPGTSWTFTAPIGKKYVVHCDTAAYFSAGSIPFGNIRLVVNGDAGPSVILQNGTLVSYVPVHVMHAATLAAGSNTIKLQWAAGSGNTMNVNSFAYANYVVTG